MVFNLFGGIFIMKKNLLVAAMATMMVMGGAMTAHAEEIQWIKDPSTWDRIKYSYEGLI